MSRYQGTYDESYLRHFIDQAVREDEGDGDHTSISTIPAGKQGVAKLIIKEGGILAGIHVAQVIFNQIDPALTVAVFHQDGDRVNPGDIGLEVNGSIHSILLAERLVLNIMQRMSGIATTTARIVSLLAGTKTKVLDTRKTTPLLRFLEKEAVRIGGGTNHRIGLYDMILIKDNHVDYAGGIGNAIKAAREYRLARHKAIDIEIEVRSFEELQLAMEIGGIERIMLDNFEPENVRKAVELVAGKYVLEASGGITEKNVRAYAEAGVDFVSLGSLTHSVKSLDISLKAKSI